MATIIKIVCAADGGKTPYDGQYVVSWNPHTEYGTFAADTTRDVTKARRFDNPVEALIEWRRISNVQPVRPDGMPNRPLSGVTVEFENV